MKRVTGIEMLHGRSLVQRKLVLLAMLPSPHSESSSSSRGGSISRDQGCHLHGRVQKVDGPRINPGKDLPHMDGMIGMDNSLRQTALEGQVAVQDSGHPSRLVRTLQTGEDLLQALHQQAPLLRVGLVCHQIGAALPHHRMCNSQGRQSVAVLAVVAAVVVAADAAHHLVTHTVGGANEDCRMHSCQNETRRDLQLQKLTGGMQTGINNQFRRGKRCRIRNCKTKLSEASS